MYIYSILDICTVYVCVNAASLYLEVAVDYAVFVQVADCLQHLSDDQTSIGLWIHAPVQDPVEQFTTWNADGIWAM